MLGFSPDFAIDPAEVERAYLARVAASHPDLAGNDPTVAARAAATSAQLNQAREILLDDEQRSWALLDILWKDSQQDCKAGPRDALPDGFLMEMMQTRMAIEEATEEQDHEQLDHWRDWAQDEQQRFRQTVADLFAKAATLARAEHTPDEDLHALYQQIRTQLNAWRYIVRLIEQLPAADR